MSGDLVQMGDILREAGRLDEALLKYAEAVKVIEGEIDVLLKRRRDAELAYAAFIESIVRTFETTRATSRPSVNAFP